MRAQRPACEGRVQTELRLATRPESETASHDSLGKLDGVIHRPQSYPLDSTHAKIGL
jgi:hypothetical protein